MTAYFDDLRTRISTLSRECERDDEAFLSELAQIENDVIKTVSLVTGDREFPDDLRELIQTHIACLRVDSGELPPTPGREHSRVCRYSCLLEELHDDFHRVARRKIETRFGRLFDDPSGIVRKRDAWDQETAT